MSKFILSILVISLTVVTAVAQVHKRVPAVVGAEKNMTYRHSANHHRLGNENIARAAKSASAQKMKPLKAGENKIPDCNLRANSVVQKEQISASIPDKLIGTFICKGTSYFGGIVTGETVITADELNANKIWFSNLVPEASTQQVYGIVSSDQKTISIPQNQQIYIDGADRATLSMYGSTSSIKGEFDAETGVITITSDLWGSKASDGWFELFSGEVTYTRNDMLPPVASYRQPDGGLFLGLDPDTWGFYNSSCMVSSPYVTWNWMNTGLAENVEYYWNYTDSLTGETFNHTADSLVMNVRDSYYNTPRLTAVDERNFSSSFILGADYVNKDYPSYSIAGGGAYLVGFDSNCDHGVANQDNGFTLLNAGGDAYYFGTGASQFADANYESLLVYYDEPLSALYFEGVNVYLYVFDAPENTTFTMNVVLAEKDENGYSLKGRVVATKNISSNDVVTVTYDNQIIGYTMKFSDFQILDEDGFFIEQDYVEIDKAFFLELTGFNVDGVSLGVCTEEINPTDGESRSNFIFEGDESIYFWENYRQTMYFNLAGAAYPYVSLSQETIYDDRSGGTHEVYAYPFFDTLYFAGQTFPDWLHAEIVDEEYSDTKWEGKVRVNIEPLAADAEARYYDLVLKTTAATRIITINQGGPVSAPSLRDDNLVRITRNTNGFLINYPEQKAEMTLYTVAGSLVGRYKLPESGKYLLTDQSLSKGVYIVKVQGEDYSRSIKISK